jgi:hypothetical protein
VAHSETTGECFVANDEGKAIVAKIDEKAEGAAHFESD